MKVVLFCGGLGTRLREHSDTIPKPLVTIGYRPLLWHLMRYYAHFGHKEFILCLGYRGDMIREYFLRYNDAMSNDFTLSEGGSKIELHTRDAHDWVITFVDTGLHSTIGERLLQVQKYLRGDTEFLANYSDGLSSVSLDQQLAHFRAKRAVASFVCVPSPLSFHAVQSSADGTVTAIGATAKQQMRINGGFFAFTHEIFNYVKAGEELVDAPFARLIAEKRLVSFPWEGFWRCMDTFKDKITFDRMEASGDSPWKVWQPSRGDPGSG